MPSRRHGEHIAGRMANSAITGPQALIVAGNRAYRSPKMPGWDGHMGNVGSCVPDQLAPAPIRLALRRADGEAECGVLHQETARRLHDLFGRHRVGAADQVADALELPGVGLGDG